MKKTTTKTKLVLAREQIRLLTPDNLVSARGGAHPTLAGCDKTTSSGECGNNTGKYATCG